MRTRPHATIAVVALGWGSIGVIVREVDLPAAAIVSVRVWVATAALAAWLAWRRERIAGPALLRHRPWTALATGALLAGHWVALFAALQRAPIGTVLLITYLAPLGIALAAPRALGETLAARSLVALGAALAGMALVVAPVIGADAPDNTNGSTTTGLVLAGLAAASYVVLVLVSKPLSEAYGGVRLALVEMATAGVVLVPVAVGLDWGSPRWSWLWLLVLGLVHTALAVALYLSALARVPATHAGILAYLEPAGAVLFGWLLLSEEPDPATLVGGVLILAAAGLVLSDPRRASVTEVAGVPG